MILAEMERKTLERSGRCSDAQVAAHHVRVRRILALVGHGRGRFTTTSARRLTGWEERSIQRYVNELAGAGLIYLPNGRSWPRIWALTQAGTDELRNHVDRVT